MSKSYLITLDKTDLQSIIFETIDRAIKINRIPTRISNTDGFIENVASRIGKGKKVVRENKKEALNG